jgi:ABC-type branched-subunit amino acid transport system ATPase component
VRAELEPPDEALPVGAALPDLGRIAARTQRAQASEQGVTTPVLRTEALCVAFGGLQANRDVSIEVRPGEVVGLIGTNGAGKSTLMNAIGGFAPTASGRVEIFGQDVTTWSPHERADLGVGRVFQDARLYPELTVRECISVALEARRRSEFVPSLLGLASARRVELRTRREADELILALGLGRYAVTRVAELSTGTRRIVELASLAASQARLLMLDEPTAGVAQRETEAFGPLLRTLQQALGASILLIEHDMPLVMSLSDRIYCLQAGEVIAEGAPDDVRNDPLVVASYLGTDERAIQRSDAAAGSGRRLRRKVSPR